MLRLVALDHQICCPVSRGIRYLWEVLNLHLPWDCPRLQTCKRWTTTPSQEATTYFSVFSHGFWLHFPPNPFKFLVIRSILLQGAHRSTACLKKKKKILFLFLSDNFISWNLVSIGKLCSASSISFNALDLMVYL